MVVQTQAAKRRCRSRERTDMSDIGRLLMSSGCRERFWGCLLFQSIRNALCVRDKEARPPSGTEIAGVWFRWASEANSEVWHPGVGITCELVISAALSQCCSEISWQVLSIPDRCCRGL